MKLKDAIKHAGKPFEIPDAERDDLPQFFVDMGYKVGAEIGTREGYFAEKICKAGLMLYAIDPWRNYDGYFGEGAFKNEVDANLKSAKKLLKPFKHKIVKKMSLDALKDFEDNSLDFVYIDGNHDFRYVADDLYEWTKKVKPGGTIAGHDYFYCRPREFDNIHVKYVVDAFTKCYNINNWYVIGRKETIKGEKRDKFRSFFWIKT